MEYINKKKGKDGNPFEVDQKEEEKIHFQLGRFKDLKPPPIQSFHRSKLSPFFALHCELFKAKNSSKQGGDGVKEDKR